MQRNQQGFILIYLVMLLFIITSSLLTLTAQYERMQRSQANIQTPFQALLEKSVLKASKN
ncbi:MAG: hypothetical protein ACRCWD_06935 [Culicoidibacterales bacterium]